MEIHRLLHWPTPTNDGTWVVIGETRSEAEMLEVRRNLKRNAIINTHIVKCTMDHRQMGIEDNENDHKMKVQWAKCTSALCRPNKSRAASDSTKCPAQVRMSTCLLTYHGVICQAYTHLSDANDSAEPLQSCVTDKMKTHVLRMLQENAKAKPMQIYKDLEELHTHGEFGADPMPTKTQLRNALTYLKNRKLKITQQ